MEAKDTVMSKDTALAISAYREQIKLLGEEAGVNLWWEELERFLIHQAEISCEAGRQEVVEWLQEENAEPDEIRDKWQAQLKVWGIKTE